MEMDNHAGERTESSPEQPGATQRAAVGHRPGARLRDLRSVRPLLADVLIVAVVLAVLGWGLDWASRIGAQSVMARSVQRSEQLSQRPDVDVHGWFFLPQAVSGRYGEVDIAVHDLRRETLRLAAVTARLYGVHVPLHAVVTGSVSMIFVERTRETAVLSYADLNAYLTGLGDAITVSAGPSGQLKLTGHTVVLGHSLSISADAKVQPVPGYLQITPTQLQTGTPLDTGSRLLLGQRLTLSIPTNSLPFGQQVTAIHPGKQQLTVEAGGNNILISRP